MPTLTVNGRSVVTIEALSPAGAHPVQKAWVELQVPQCGYCQSGMIMAASALLAKTPRPTDADIDIDTAMTNQRSGASTPANARWRQVSSTTRPAVGRRPSARWPPRRAGWRCRRNRSSRIRKTGNSSALHRHGSTFPTRPPAGKFSRPT